MSDRMQIKLCVCKHLWSFCTTSRKARAPSQSAHPGGPSLLPSLAREGKGRGRESYK